MPDGGIPKDMPPENDPFDGLGDFKPTQINRDKRIVPVEGSGIEWTEKPFGKPKNDPNAFKTWDDIKDDDIQARANANVIPNNVEDVVEGVIIDEPETDPDATPAHGVPPVNTTIPFMDPEDMPKVKISEKKSTDDKFNFKEEAAKLIATPEEGKEKEIKDPKIEKLIRSALRDGNLKNIRDILSEGETMARKSEISEEEWETKAQPLFNEELNNLKKRAQEKRKDREEKALKNVQERYGRFGEREKMEVPPKKIRTPEEEAVFGRVRFSDRWVEQHMDVVIYPNYASQITQPFWTSEFLNEIANSTQTTVSPGAKELVSSTCKDTDFRTALNGAIIPLLVVNRQLGANRIDTAAEASQQITPLALAELILTDDEVARALTLIFRLQGYNVPDTTDKNGNNYHDLTPADRVFDIAVMEKDEKTQKIDPVTGQPLFEQKIIPFSDIVNINNAQIEVYLDDIRKSIVVDKTTNEVTDPGVIRLAYTFFRLMGYPQGNDKFSKELIGKYTKNYKIKGVVQPITSKDGDDNRDLSYKDVCPFPEDLKVEDIYGRKVPLISFLENGGVKEFATVALTNLDLQQGQKLQRETADLDLMLKVMDGVADIRSGVGGQGSLPVEQRQAAIEKLGDLGAAGAKRKFEPETLLSLYDTDKIKVVPEQNARNFFKQLNLATRMVFSPRMVGHIGNLPLVIPLGKRPDQKQVEQWQKHIETKKKK